MKSLQKTIFDHNGYLPDKRIAALNKYWAGPFREKVLPLIDEEPFRPFYHPDNGRPNVPVITLIAASLYERLPKVYRKVYRERSGYFADVKSSKAKRRLAKCARHLFDLVDRFRGDPEVARLRAYGLMSRLLDEQCEVAQAEAPKVTLKKPEDIPGDSLQNPSDPDAAYGHKGKGYKASLTETCAEENGVQVITDVWVDGANASDQKDVPKVIERLDEADTKPEELFADAGYGS